MILVYTTATLGLITVLAWVTWIDLKQHRLPDLFTLPLIGAGVALAAFDGGLDLTSSVIGGIAGFAVFWLIGHLYFTRYGREGLGLGDAKLFAASGTWLGYMLLPQVLLVASVSGIIYALSRKNGTEKPLAFGPWLSFGFFVIWMKQYVAIFL